MVGFAGTNSHVQLHANALHASANVMHATTLEKCHLAEIWRFHLWEAVHVWDAAGQVGGLEAGHLDAKEVHLGHPKQLTVVDFRA